MYNNSAEATAQTQDHKLQETGAAAHHALGSTSVMDQSGSDLSPAETGDQTATGLEECRQLEQTIADAMALLKPSVSASPVKSHLVPGTSSLSAAPPVSGPASQSAVLPALPSAAPSASGPVAPPPTQSAAEEAPAAAAQHGVESDWQLVTSPMMIQPAPSTSAVLVMAGKQAEDPAADLSFPSVLATAAPAAFTSFLPSQQPVADSAGNPAVLVISDSETDESLPSAHLSKQSQLRSLRAQVNTARSALTEAAAAQGQTAVAAAAVKDDETSEALPAAASEVTNRKLLKKKSRYFSQTAEEKKRRQNRLRKQRQDAAKAAEAAGVLPSNSTAWDEANKTVSSPAILPRVQSPTRYKYTGNERYTFAN